MGHAHTARQSRSAGSGNCQLWASRCDRTLSHSLSHVWQLAGVHCGVSSTVTDSPESVHQQVSPLSIVFFSQNSIRQSNQRGIVVHGTDRLRIEDNVSFDVRGHSYVLEDVSTEPSFVFGLLLEHRKYSHDVQYRVLKRTINSIVTLRSTRATRALLFLPALLP